MAGEDFAAAAADDNEREPVRPMVWPIKWELDKPVQAHGELIKEISFREPTGADIEKAGFPLDFDFRQDPPAISLNERKMAALMSLLASVPPSTIKALTPKDVLPRHINHEHAGLPAVRALSARISPSC